MYTYNHQKIIINIFFSFFRKTKLTLQVQKFFLFSDIKYFFVFFNICIIQINNMHNLNNIL